MTRRWAVPGRPAWIAAAAVAVALVAGLLVALVGRGSPTDPGTPPAAAPAPSPSPLPGANVRGPLTILIVGLDTRVSSPDWQPHADAVLVAHVAADLRSGYLFSLPRDLLVDVPPFPPAQFGGGRLKLTEAMSRGARVPGTSRPDPRQGFQLLRTAVSGYTGIARFDVAAAVTFTGLSRMVDAVGGVDLTVDMRVASLHRQPDGRHRELQPGGGGYVGPQMVYEPGPQHLVGWQAVDYARQRYLPGGDYTRQRHQRQLIAALIGKAASAGLPSDPQRLGALVDALGETLVADTGDQTPVDYAYALRHLRPESLKLVNLPGDSVGSGGGYLGEQLTEPARAFLAEAAAGRGAEHLATHPELLQGGG